MERRASSWRLAPIVTQWGGSIGYDIQQRNSSIANPVTQQRILLNLKGKALTYISKPWIAQVKGNLDFSASKMKFDEQSSSYNTVAGDAGLYLVPYSRYPFDARISRNQNYWGPGIGSLLSQTTRFDMTQRYTPRGKKDRYFINFNRSYTEAGSESYRNNGLTFSFDTSRLKKQSLGIHGARQRNIHLNDGATELFNDAAVNHRYLPNNQLTMDNNAILTSRYVQSPQLSDSYRIRELNSTLSLRPQSNYYVIGGARVNISDYNSSQKRSANGNLGVNYRLSQYINMYASGNVNVTESGSERNQTLTTTQGASANYPLAAFNLDAYRYNSRISVSINNRTNSSKRTGSVANTRQGSDQSVSVAPSHSLGRDLALNGGRLNLGLGQSISVSESTRSQARANLAHSATASWQRRQGSSNTSLRLSARDSRSLNSTQDSFQFISLNADISEEVSRDATFSGSLSVQTTRQINRISTTPLNDTSSSVNLHYNHQRAFGVRRLTFDSNLQTFSRAPIPVLVASPNNQGPVTWENTLAYTIGRLTADFKVSMSKEGDGKSQSLIYFSVKRWF